MKTVKSLDKVIKYVKRSKSSFDDFSAKHTPRAPLRKFYPVNKWHIYFLLSHTKNKSIKKML